MKTVVILGMHRSATSLVSEGIDKAGVWMGGKARSKFHWENLHFMRLNQSILKEAGGSWDNPPSREKINNVDRREKIKNLIDWNVLNAKERNCSFWGWKDPRTVLTFDLYEPYLTNLHIVTIFRDPLEVAKSLKTRNNMPISKGINLAKEYNKRIFNILQRRNLCQI